MSRSLRERFKRQQGEQKYNQSSNRKKATIDPKSDQYYKQQRNNKIEGQSQQNEQGRHQVRRSTLINPKKLVQDEELNELSNLYNMLNKECEQINSEKKIRVVERSAKKGIVINEKDVNLLAIHDGIDDDSEGESETRTNQNLLDQTFEIKLQQLDNQTLRKSPLSGNNADNHHLAEIAYHKMNQENENQSPIFEVKEEYMPSPYDSSSNENRIHFQNVDGISGFDETPNTNLYYGDMNQLRLPVMKRNESNISMISDIVKKKRITFLKSASLFADEEEIFGFGSPKLTKEYQSASEAIQQTTKNPTLERHRKLIRRHLEEKKKLEGAIERMQVGGDKQILDTISKEIQFSREKDVIQKLLISKQGPINNQNIGDSSQRRKSVKTGEKSKALKAKQEAHENAMAMLIEKVLSDPDTRERLLDHSVLNDFFFEEKLKERRMQVLQEQRAAARRKGGSVGAGSDGGRDQMHISLVSEVLDSLQHLPEVIRPEHIRVNLHASGGKMMTSKDKDNMYHRNIVKSNTLFILYYLEAIQANLNSNKLKIQRAQNLQIINYILHFTSSEQQARSKIQSFSNIINLRKFYAYVSLMNDKYGSSINFSKWISFTKSLRMFFKQHFIDTVDLEKVFYEVIRNKTPAEMNYEDFVDGLRYLSRKMVKLVVNDNESSNALLANEDMLFNRFLLQVIKPYFEEKQVLYQTLIDYSKVKETDLAYYLPEVQQIFKKNDSFMKKLYESFVEYPAEDPTQQQNNAQNPYKTQANKALGINPPQFHEVLKIIGFFPAIVAKHEINSIFTQSLSTYDQMTFSDFNYATFLIYAMDQEKKGRTSIIEDKKLTQRLHDFLFDKAGLIQGENVIKKIRDHHNTIILNQIHNKTFFGKHYSVNIKASIM
ncbi:UNKNOWN [Stylonychia lemnae]|uniref:Uncharacterized protein n=1 Tax=Stylonychia lemnae TaxID=5949 RepID=A0A078AFY8_STYLE|nr:UNKNOWN [Stylonychia lemnae]|eukprot:CDW80766.1 UNKNOWN [Stylonychia lemnae]